MMNTEPVQPIQMNPETAQPIQTIGPQLPIPNLPEVPVDPTNPLSWVILLTLFSSSAGRAINAITGLTRAITVLWLAIAKTRRSEPKKDDTSRSSKHD